MRRYLAYIRTIFLARTVILSKETISWKVRVRRRRECPNRENTKGRMMTETATADLTVAIDRNAVDRLFCDARTASHFTDAPVTDEQKRTIYELTKMGPTAFNSQPLRITWVESPEARERLVQHMSRGNQEKTRNAPLTAILSYDENWHEHFPEFLPAAPHMKGMYDENDDMRITSGLLHHCRPHRRPGRRPHDRLRPGRCGREVLRGHRQAFHRGGQPGHPGRTRVRA